MHHNLWKELCSFNNLLRAFIKARKGKTKKKYVQNFREYLTENLDLLRTELLLHSYRPQPLVNFIVRDPKTRKISKSSFRDRIVHHALCNIIEPIFDKCFIYDSWANRKKKGTLQAVVRFNHFKRKVSKNNTRTCYIFKADVKKYFENMNHELLIKIIRKKINDPQILCLINVILSNCIGGGAISKKECPWAILLPNSLQMSISMSLISL